LVFLGLIARSLFSKETQVFGHHSRAIHIIWVQNCICRVHSVDMEMFEKWAERTAFGISLVEQAFNDVFIADLG